MADDYSFKDATGTTRTSRAKEVAAGIYSNFVHLMTGGVETSDTNPLPVKGRIVRPASNALTIASLSAAPYAANDLVANHATAGSVTPLSWNVGRSSGFVRRVMLTSNRNTSPAGTPVLRMHLWTASPTPTNGDNGAFLATGLAAGAATYMGAFDFGTARAFSDGYAWLSGNPLDGAEQNFVIPSGTTLYGLLTVSPNSPSTYTPYHASNFETFYAYPEIHLF